MANVCPCIAIAARIAFAALFEYRMIVRMHRILHHEPSRPRHCHSVARHTRREYAVKHVNAVPHSREKVVRRPDAHEIARLVLRQQLHRIGENLLHQLMRLADTQPSDRISRQIEFRCLGSVPRTQIAVHAALHNTEKSLPLGIRHCVTAAHKPALCAFRRCLRIGVIGGIRDALVECHNDVRAEIFLHLHRHLGR